jgi:protein arginine kinase activator
MAPKDKPAEIPADKEPERPLECTECKKHIAVFYTEIVGDMIIRTCMCADCPVLKNKLHGAPHLEYAGNLAEIGTSLACGNCGTTLDSIKVGTRLGCNNCYEVFDDLLLAEMLAANKVPQRLASNKKSSPIHIGRAPGEIQEISPSLRLLALNEALNEMLKSEDYEQAAWLRDQIKALTEKKQENTDETK